jgi:cell division septum initiation protein DivIVA
VDQLIHQIRAAFDQQLVVGMIEDLKRQIEALTQRIAQRENPS